MIVLLQALYQHVVYVNLHIPPNLMCEHFVHHSLICGTCVLEPELHHILAEEILASNNEVFSWSALSSLIWLYLENASIKLSNWCLAVESTKTSICGSG